MRENKKTNIVVLIPAFNEEKSIGKVIDEIPKEWISEIIVCNNNSNDDTEKVALSHGATVVNQPLPGYGNACLKGIEYLKKKSQKPDIVVFIDGDYSDFPSEMPTIFLPIIEKGYDMIVGSRKLGNKEKGSITPQQIFGNWLATTLVRWIYGYHFTDLGPFRAIRWDKLLAINMVDKNYGWTVEMQIKAARYELRCTEVPVSYRQRIGVSKVSGTVKGSIMAGYKILLLIFRYAIFKVN
jgi:glycosyltransferase involved in cell wall biosynthesis